MCWSSRSVNTSQNCLMCSVVQLCCLHADLYHLTLLLRKWVLTSALVTFLIAVRKYRTAAVYERYLVLVSQFKLLYSQFTMEESHGSLRQCSHFFQPGSREEMFVLSSSLLSITQSGILAHRTVLPKLGRSSSSSYTRQYNLDIKASQTFFSQVILDFIRLTRLTVTKQFSYSQLVCLPLELCIVVFLLCILHPWMRLCL